MKYARVLQGQSLSGLSARLINDTATLLEKEPQRGKANNPPPVQQLPANLYSRVWNLTGSGCTAPYAFSLGDSFYNLAIAEEAESFRQNPLYETASIALDGLIGVYQRPVKVSGVSSAVVEGITQVECNVLYVEHTHAELNPGSPGKMVSGFAGQARIVSLLTGIGLQRVLVQFPSWDEPEIEGKAAAPISPGNTGYIDVYRNGAPSGVPQTVRLINIPGISSIAMNDIVSARWAPDRHEFIIYKSVSSPSTPVDVAIIRIHESGGIPNGQLVNRNSACLFNGQLVTEDLTLADQCGAVWTTGADVWVKAVNTYPEVLQLRKDQKYLAHKAGIYTAESITRDLYQIQDIAALNETAVVRFFESSGFDYGELRDSNAHFLFPGFIQLQTLPGSQANGGLWTDGSPCWIFPVNWIPLTTKLYHAERYIGRLVGQYTVSGDTRDLYQIYDRQREAVDDSVVTDLDFDWLFNLSLVADSGPVKMLAGNNVALISGASVLPGDTEIIFDKGGRFLVDYSLKVTWDGTFPGTNSGGIGHGLNYSAYWSNDGLAIYGRVNSTIAAVPYGLSGGGSPVFTGYHYTDNFPQFVSGGFYIELADGDELACYVTDSSTTTPHGVSTYKITRLRIERIF